MIELVSDSAQVAYGSLPRQRFVAGIDANYFEKKEWRSVREPIKNWRSRNKFEPLLGVPPRFLLLPAERLLQCCHRDVRPTERRWRRVTGRDHREIQQHRLDVLQLKEIGIRGGSLNRFDPESREYRRDISVCLKKRNILDPTPRI